MANAGQLQALLASLIWNGSLGKLEVVHSLPSTHRHPHLPKQTHFSITTGISLGTALPTVALACIFHYARNSKRARSNSALTNLFGGSIDVVWISALIYHP